MVVELPSARYLECFWSKMSFRMLFHLLLWSFKKKSCFWLSNFSDDKPLRGLHHLRFSTNEAD